MTKRLGLSAMQRRTQYAPLAALGAFLPQRDFFAPLWGHVQLGGKTIFHDVWSKNSCGLSLVVFKQATKPFTRLNRPVIPALWPGLWKEQHIALALMIALLVIMVYILIEHMPQRVLAEQNHP